MATRQVMRHCEHCAQQTLHLQQYMSAGTHIVLLLITGGLWLFVLLAYYLLAGWLIEPVRKAMDKGKCTVCGSVPRPTATVPPSAPIDHSPSGGGSNSSAIDPTAKWILVACGCVVLLGAIGARGSLGSPTPAASVNAAPQESSTPTALRQVTSAPPARQDEWIVFTGALSDTELGLVCQAVVAAMMGHPIEIVHVERVRNGEADVRYNRPNDGTLWRTRCRMEAGAVVWRTIDAFGPGSGLGRWRNGPNDSRITVAIRENALRVVEAYPDGSASQREFDLAYLFE